mmetsp:Transcript_14243/g.44760  ORF Transcript_14243/g.44760 Transcript_14243/m.44760 type:complete len:586 (+) Transcript_14243:33-1790(+)
MSARSAARFSELHPQEPSSSRDFGFVTFTGARARSTGTATHFTNVSCESFFTTSSLCGGPGGPGLSSLLTHSALRPARAAAAGYPGATILCMQLLGHALAPPVRRILDAPPRPLRRAGHPYVRDTPPRAVLRRLGLGRRTVVVGLLHHLRVWLEDGLARPLFGDEEDDGEQKEGADDGANHDARNLAAGEAVVGRWRRGWGCRPEARISGHEVGERKVELHEAEPEVGDAGVVHSDLALRGVGKEDGLVVEGREHEIVLRLALVVVVKGRKRADVRAELLEGHALHVHHARRVRLCAAPAVRHVPELRGGVVGRAPGLRDGEVPGMVLGEAGKVAVVALTGAAVIIEAGRVVTVVLVVLVAVVRSQALIRDALGVEPGNYLVRDRDGERVVRAVQDPQRRVREVVGRDAGPGLTELLGARERGEHAAVRQRRVEERVHLRLRRQRALVQLGAARLDGAHDKLALVLGEDGAAVEDDVAGIQFGRGLLGDEASVGLGREEGLGGDRVDAVRNVERAVQQGVLDGVLRRVRAQDDAVVGRVVPVALELGEEHLRDRLVFGVDARVGIFKREARLVEVGGGEPTRRAF